MAKKAQKPIEFITPPNVLRAKLATASPAVKNPLALADEALKSISDDCKTWLHDEIETLHHHRLAFAKAPEDEGTLKDLTATAMEIKGLAIPAGCEDADAFAASLLNLLTAPGSPAKSHVDLVEAHVDAIRAARDKKHSPKVVAALAAELTAQTSDLAAGVP